MGAHYLQKDWLKTIEIPTFMGKIAQLFIVPRGHGILGSRYHAKDVFSQESSA